MATKAELEAELLKLRSELSDVKSIPKATPETSGSDNAAAETEPEEAAAEDHHANVIDSIREGDIEGIVKTLMEELDDLPNRKPILTAVGAFIAGYLIGRSGRKG